MICLDTSVTLSKSRNSMELNEGESKYSHKKLFNTPPCKVTEIIQNHYASRNENSVEKPHFESSYQTLYQAPLYGVMKYFLILCQKDAGKLTEWRNSLSGHKSERIMQYATEGSGQKKKYRNMKNYS